MIRLLLLLFLGLAGQVHAQGVVSQGGGGRVAASDGMSGFDADLLTKVQTEAIDFMLPRMMEAGSATQLAIWGLAGLTNLDPALGVTYRDGRLRLLTQGRSVVELLVSPNAAGAVWAQAVTQIVTAGFATSPALRGAGGAMVTKALFDEMLAHLDPYSRYIPPLEAMSDRDRRVGHAGIGLTLAQRGRAVVVREVIIGSPGALAGVRPGDVIQWVDENTAAGRDPATVADMLHGPEGTELRMGWMGQDGRARGATLTRIMTPSETVFPRRMGKIAVIQITGFSQTTDRNVARVLRGQIREGQRLPGVILDLRGNRGGLLRSAVGTAGIFLGPGIVVTSAGRAPEANRVWLSNGGEGTKGTRLVVLVDGGTASAAEVLAAALADRGRAVVVGSSTFGKGLVQTIDALPDGGELFLTWSRLLAPRGWPIQSLGVLPQICTSLGEERLRRQLAALTAGGNEMTAALKAHRDARAPVTPDQIVAIRESCPASDPRDTDLEVARTVIDNPTGYAAALLPVQGPR